MTSRRLSSFILAAATGVLCALPAGPLYADDTDIYLGTEELSEGIRPNIMFVVDTSGSMGNFDGQPKDRLDWVEDAFNLILDDAHNVNIGLMRFTDPGGPVLFPIAYVDANAVKVEQGPGASVNIRVAAGADDAEQLGVAMKTDSVQLELMHNPAFGAESFYVVAVDAGENDAEQGRDPGTGAQTFYNNTSNTLESVYTDSAGLRTNGLRFENLPANTAGATVLHADVDFYERNDHAGPVTLTFVGHDVDDSDAFPTNATPTCPAATDPGGDIFCRVANARTSARVNWDPPDLVAGARVRSHDLSPIFQEIFARPGWQAVGGANDLSILYTGTQGARRDFSAYNDSAARAPILSVDYVAAGAPSGTQRVGFRFRDVDIPQGMRITSASIRLTPRRSSTVPVNMRIYAHDVASAGDFATTNISSRAKTTALADWDLTAADGWSEDSVVQTPDLAKVVNEVINRADWCGGNDMAFIFEADGLTGPRIVHAFENDPSRAAVLHIEYDDETPLGAGEGCVRESISRQVSATKDDAEEFTGFGLTNISRNLLPIGSFFGFPVKVGIRFREVDVPAGATITNATLQFRAVNAYGAGATTWAIRGEKTADALEFQASLNNITNRNTTGNVANFSTPPSAVAAGDTFSLSSPALATVIDEIINGTSWQEGNDLALLLTAAGEVDVSSFDDNASRAPILRLDVEYRLGDIQAATGAGSPAVTVRTRLREVMNQLAHNGFTPIVDTLYEAGLYFRGDRVLYGKDRGTGDTLNQQQTRVSHPASYTGGTVSRSALCTDDNLSNPACITEEILDTPEPAVYTSPITDQCQANFIVLLTDGAANHNHSQGLIRSLTGASPCVQTLSNGAAVDAGEECGIDLVEWMHNNDQRTGVSGDNIVSTYAIGFNFTTQFLRDLANKGGGSFFEASTAQQLADVFDAILADILSQTTSFAAPSLSVNAFNRLFHRNEVYFSLFEPTNDVSWKGNVKKYQLRQSCQGVTGECQVGEVLDSRVPPDGPLPAIGDDERIRDDALSFWSGTPDGAEILVGGAGSVLTTQAARTVYTFLGAGAPGNTTLDSAHEIRDDNADGVLDGISTGSADSRLQRTKDLLAFPGNDVATLNATEKQALRDALHDHIQWIRGIDVDDEDADGDRAERRYAFNDPLHSSPVAVTYGAEDATDPDNTVIIKAFVGTNDGGVRMVNGFNGEEEWIFYPPEMLPLQNTLRQNPAGDHLYGIDGTPTVWLNDVNNDGLVTPSQGDFVRVFIGMRRGGNLLYALEATPTNVAGVQDREATNEVPPTYRWRIQGGSPEFPRLGQTWSRPRLATILRGDDTQDNVSVAKKVLIFAGGYDDGQDSGFGAALGASLGNAIYGVDAETGAREFWVSANGAGDHGAGDGQTVPGMVYPIPSDVALMDSDGDGAVNRLYVGDVGGQMWRVDIDADLTAINSKTYELTVGRMATVSFPKSDDPSTAAPDAVDQRKFFYPPDVVQVRGGQGFSSVDDYDLLAAVTGNRASPLNLTVQDRFFAFRDYGIHRMSDTTPDDGLADGFSTGNSTDTLQGQLVDPVTGGDLFDMTNVNDPTGTDLAQLEIDDGYYIDFIEAGEKGLAAPIILAGKVFFTTYLPEGVVTGSSCSLAEGGGLLYGLNVLNGAAVFNWDSPEGDPKTVADRTMTLGAGIPSAAVPVFQPEAVTLLIGGGGGATVVDPNISLPRQRTYWFNQ